MEKLLQTYKAEYIKEYLSPIVYQLCYENWKMTVFVAGVIGQ
jgi:hypothetical protein